MTELQTISLEQLRSAVQRGVITQQQLAAILDAAGASDAERTSGVEAVHALNAVSVAYYIGAAAVVFALGWFLVDQWEHVGSGGVLAIAFGYALIFGAAGSWLLRRHFHTAASMAVLLTVCTVPVMTWAILDLVAWWPIAARRNPFNELRWIPVELALVAAALAALRRVSFALLALPVAAGTAFALLHLRVLTRDVTLASQIDPYLGFVSGTLFIAAAYVVDRWELRTNIREDYAFWPYLFGLGSLTISLISLWDRSESVVSHVTLALALTSIAVAIRLGRRTFLVAGAVGVVAYLGHLADEFRNTSLFPLVLALAGGLVILATVWMQRRYPNLVRGSAARGRLLPGDLAGPLSALVIALIVVGWAKAKAPEWHAEEQTRAKEEMQRRPEVAPRRQ